MGNRPVLNLLESTFKDTTRAHIVGERALFKNLARDLNKASKLAKSRLAQTDPEVTAEHERQYEEIVELSKKLQNLMSAHLKSYE